MNRSTIIFGVMCFIIGALLGYLIAYVTTPQTPEQQRAQAQLMLAQAKVEDAKAEQIRLQTRVSESISGDLASVQKFSAIVSALLIPLACVLIIIALGIWLYHGWRQDNAVALAPSAQFGAAVINQFQKSFSDEEPVAHKTVVYTRSKSTDEKVKRDLTDVREFITQGVLRGFARETWIGNANKSKPRYHFKSGHDCDRPRYEALIELCRRANVFDESDGTPKLACSLDDALDAFSDGETEQES